MDYRKLAEGTVTNMITYIQSNISAALDTVGANATTPPSVNIPNPKEYFIFPKPHGYQLPAIFVLCDDFDFNIDKMKSNFVNATVKVNVSAVIEGQTEDETTYVTWRYLSALHSVLDQTPIISTDNLLKLVVVVYHASFSPLYMRTESNGDGGKFRKEIVLKCDVTHLENY
jgi:hypothetical protein